MSAFLAPEAIHQPTTSVFNSERSRFPSQAATMNRRGNLFRSFESRNVGTERGSRERMGLHVLLS
jgi:hypothetical protein